MASVVWSAASFAEPLTPEMRREDPNLARLVSVRSARLFVGDLVERMSAQTGVTVRLASPPDGAGDEVLLANLPSVPLGDAMDALWSLVSYRDARWHWARAGEPGNYAYILSRPPAARRLPAELRREMTLRFTDETTALLLAATGAISQDQLPDRLRSSLGLPEGTAMQRYMPSTQDLDGLRMMAQSLSGADIDDVLGGRRTVSVPVDRLTSQGAAFVERLVSQTARKVGFPGGPVHEAPRPDSVAFEVEHYGGGVPVLAIGLGAHGAYGYSGAAPLERAMGTMLRDRWMLPGDTPQCTAEELPLGAVTQVSGRAETNDELLLRITDVTNVPMLMRYPVPVPLGFRPTTGEKIKDMLARLERDPAPYSHRWRGGVLLVEWLNWYLYEEHHVPWHLVKEMRSDCRRNGNRVPMDTTLRAAARLTGGQVKMNRSLLPGGDELAPRREFLAGLAAYASALTSDSGRVLDEDLARRLGPYLPPGTDLGDGTVRRVRIRRVALPYSPPLDRANNLEMRRGREQWLPLTSIMEPVWEADREYAPVAVR